MTDEEAQWPEKSLADVLEERDLYRERCKKLRELVDALREPTGVNEVESLLAEVDRLRAENASLRSDMAIAEASEKHRVELIEENARQAETIAKLQLACRGVLQFADRLPDHTTVALREALKESQ